MTGVPRVSIGLPVFNGERHLARSLDAILAQTFSDFELIISDNGSSDATAESCRDYAARDPRIRYVRHEINQGAARNFNQTFELARGEYFKWAAHDDIIAPTFLEKCVAALDAAPQSAVLAFPRRQHTSYDGQRLIGTSLQTPVGASVEVSEEKMVSWPYGADIRDLSFAELLRLPLSWFPMFVFGLLRASALRGTRLIGAFGGSDVVLVLELRMLGEFVPVREDLYFQRLHPPAGWTMRRTRAEETSWFDPSARRPRLPLRAQLYLEFLRSIYRVPVSPVIKFHRYRDIGNQWSRAILRHVGLSA